MSDNHVIIHEEDCIVTVGDDGLYLNCKYTRFSTEDVINTHSLLLTSVKTVSSEELESLKFQAINNFIDELESEDEESNP